MLRYRFIQTNTVDPQIVLSGFNLAPQGYNVFNSSLELRGWVIAKDEMVEKLEIFIYANFKRKLIDIEKFNDSPDIAELFPGYAGINQARFKVILDPNQIHELKDKKDFAIEMVVHTKSAVYCFKTITFVKDDDMTQAVFVVGSPRSGTSILGNTLSDVLMGENQFGESHVLTLMHELQLKIDEYYKGTPASHLNFHMLSEYNRYLLIAQLQNVFKLQYAGIARNGSFVDKTPGIPMLNALPIIVQMWPQAKIVFAKRRGIENIVSRMRKFKDVGFENHCRQWSNTMLLWQSLSSELPNRIEIDQYDIQQEPKTVAKALKDFLGLDLYKESQIAKSFMHNRPESTSKPTDLAALDLFRIEWTDQQKELFKMLCNQAMQIYNYSDDSSYYLS
ncbi:MAG: sulfotransferase [Trueperaceae bacterium]|nr:sulfotransferase [Trueperaceae bacterium]